LSIFQARAATDWGKGTGQSALFKHPLNETERNTVATPPKETEQPCCIDITEKGAGLWQKQYS
ncbi:MAG: hypothetical protein WC291_09185, partial [Thermodesulfovibrionales bacterium]